MVDPNAAPGGTDAEAFHRIPSFAVGPAVQRRDIAPPPQQRGRGNYRVMPENTIREEPERVFCRCPQSYDAVGMEQHRY